MAWELKEAEINSMLRQSGQVRYRYFVKRVVDEEQVWSLRDDTGWALAEGEPGQELVPVWPHQEFANLCALAGWAGQRAEAIPLATWLSRWTPGIKNDNRLVAVFPTPDDKGVKVGSDALAFDLRDELKNY